MARGVGKLCWGKNENWGSEEQNEKEGKRGKEKEEKEKGECDFFVNIWHTLLLIIVYYHDISWSIKGKNGCWGKNIKTEDLEKK